MTSGATVFEAAIRVKSIRQYRDKNLAKRENIEIKEFFLQKYPFNRWYRNVIHSLLRRAHARETERERYNTKL